MATSETQICNLALTRLGHSQIASLTEGTKAADLCNLHYEMCRDMLLRSHPWNFAIARAALAEDGTAPNHEYDNRFALPVDCLKVIRTSWEATGFAGAAIYGFPGFNGDYAPSIPYRIEGRYLLTNESTVSIEYIQRVTDVTQFDELFVDVLAQRVAAELSLALTDSKEAAKQAWDLYAVKWSEATIADAMEGTPREVVDVSAWLRARG